MQHMFKQKRLNLKEERPLCSCSCCGAPILKRLDMKEVWHKQDSKIMISFCLSGVIQVRLGESKTIFSVHVKIAGTACLWLLSLKFITLMFIYVSLTLTTSAILFLAHPVPRLWTPIFHFFFFCRIPQLSVLKRLHKKEVTFELVGLSFPDPVTLSLPVLKKWGAKADKDGNKENYINFSLAFCGYANINSWRMKSALSNKVSLVSVTTSTSTSASWF